MRQLLGSSVNYRIAVGPQAGRKALVLRTIACRVEHEVGAVSAGHRRGLVDQVALLALGSQV